MSGVHLVSDVLIGSYGYPPLRSYRITSITTSSCHRWSPRWGPHRRSYNQALPPSTHRTTIRRVILAGRISLLRRSPRVHANDRDDAPSRRCVLSCSGFSSQLIIHSYRRHSTSRRCFSRYSSHRLALRPNRPPRSMYRSLCRSLLQQHAATVPNILVDASPDRRPLVLPHSRAQPNTH